MKGKRYYLKAVNGVQGGMKGYVTQFRFEFNFGNDEIQFKFEYPDEIWIRFIIKFDCVYFFPNKTLQKTL